MPKPDDAAGPELADYQPGHHWFEAVAAHAGPAYLRYSFTKGTVNEVDFLEDVLAQPAGARLLDLGCGPGRHSLEFARRGWDVTGIDISQDFVELGREAAENEGLSATFLRGDIRDLPDLGPFDAVISLCQGGFGLPVARGDGVDDDLHILNQMAGQLRPGGRLALSAFSAYFQVRFLEEENVFDAERGVNLENATVKNPDGEDAIFPLWTRCFTPSELRLLAAAAELQCDHIWSVTPGAYARTEPSIESPEFLLVATMANVHPSG